MTPAEIEALGLSPAEMRRLLAGFTEETVVVGSRAQPRSATEVGGPGGRAVGHGLGQPGGGRPEGPVAHHRPVVNTTPNRSAADRRWSARPCSATWRRTTRWSSSTASAVIAPDTLPFDLYLHQASFAYSTLSYPDFEDVRDGTVEVFSDLAASQYVPVTIDRAEGGGVGGVPAEAVTGNYFPMLGSRPPSDARCCRATTSRVAGIRCHARLPVLAKRSRR